MVALLSMVSASRLLETLEGHLLIQDGQQAAVQAKHHTGLGSGEEACRMPPMTMMTASREGTASMMILTAGRVLDVGGLIALLDGDV